MNHELGPCGHWRESISSPEPDREKKLAGFGH